MPSGRPSHGHYHHRPHYPSPQPLDRLYNWCSRCGQHWDQALRPTCTCFPGTESWRIRFLSSIPYFDMAHSRKHSESPPLMFNEPMLPPIEPGTRREPNLADWSWEAPPPLLQPPIVTTSPHSLDPYEYYSSPRRDSKRYSQWQPQPAVYASPPLPPPPQSYSVKRRHFKNGPQHVSHAYQVPYDSGYASSSSNGIPPPSATALHPGVQVYAQRPKDVPFMYRRRDTLLSPNHR
jgi:hypothetical protein